MSPRRSLAVAAVAEDSDLLDIDHLHYLRIISVIDGIGGDLW